MTTTAYEAKKYLADKFETVIESIDPTAVITYGSSRENQTAVSIEVLEIEWSETTFTSYRGQKPNVGEEYTVMVGILLIDARAEPHELDESLYNIYEAIEMSIRDDVTLNGLVDSALCQPDIANSGPWSEGGYASMMTFKVRCKKQRLAL